MVKTPFSAGMLPGELGYDGPKPKPLNLRKMDGRHLTVG